jgi:hypothetical protein
LFQEAETILREVPQKPVEAVVEEAMAEVVEVAEVQVAEDQGLLLLTQLQR